MSEMVTVYGVGDVYVLRENPESIFANVAPILKEADIRFCQLEQNFSERGSPQPHIRGPLRAHPRNVVALTFAGFDVVSFASNHVLDYGVDAFLDTIEVVTKSGIALVGAGRDIHEARKPAIVERKGTKVAFLAYCSILQPGFDAGVDKPGCAPIRVRTLYEPIEYQPGVPCKILTYAYPEDVEAMEQDIREARRLADVVIVSMHWGIHYMPATIAMYQRDVGHAAVDAGADLILGHHGEILKGVEVYRGRTIFYSLCNFAAEDTYEVVLERARKRPEVKVMWEAYGWRPDPDYPRYCFPVDSRKSMVAKCLISDKKIGKVSFLPVFINRYAEPRILTCEDEEFDQVVRYMQVVTEGQGLNAKYTIKGNEVLISA